MKKIKLYHGSNKPIKKFNKKYSAQGVFWFSEDKNKILQGESGASKVDYLIEVEVLVNKTAGWSEYEKFGLGQIEDMKYDSIKLDDDWIIFDSNNIKIIKAHNVKKLKEKTYYTNLSTYELNERPDNLKPTSSIFKLGFAYPIEIDIYVNRLFDKLHRNPDLYKHSFQCLSKTLIGIDLIVPTQLFLLKSKMEKKYDSFENPSGIVDYPEVIRFNELYYLMDGHHRVARMILDGYSFVPCKVHDITVNDLREGKGDKFINSKLFFYNEFSYPKQIQAFTAILTKGRTLEGKKYIDILREKQLQKIQVDSIVPIYEDLHFKTVLNIKTYKSNKISEFVKFQNQYYLLNDHYKVVKQILEGKKYIEGKVIDMNVKTDSNFKLNVPELYTPMFEENIRVEEGLTDSIITFGLDKIVEFIAKTTDQKIMNIVTSAVFKNKQMLGRVLDSVKDELI